MAATAKNTVFTTICDYPNPEMVSEPLLRSAEHFGIDVQFASYGQPFRCLFEKFPKMYNYLRHLPSSIEYAFFMDCRDSVFAGTAEMILRNFNDVYTDGILLQAYREAAVRGYVSPVLIKRMAGNAPHHPIACSGCYAGAVSELIPVLERAMELRRNIDALNLGAATVVDELAKIYLDDPGSASSIHKLDAHDEFMFQLLQITDPRIHLDHDKHVSAFFSVADADKRFLSLPQRRELPVSDIASVGTAYIFQAPGLSKRLYLWGQWVDHVIKTSKICQINNMNDVQGVPYP